MNSKQVRAKPLYLRYLFAVISHFAFLFLLLCLFSAVLSRVEKFERFYPVVSLAAHALAGIVPALFVRKTREKALFDALILAASSSSLTALISLLIHQGRVSLSALLIRIAVLSLATLLFAFLFTRLRIKKNNRNPDFKFGS